MNCIFLPWWKEISKSQNFPLCWKKNISHLHMKSMLTDVACSDVCAELSADRCAASAPLPHACIAPTVDITNSACMHNMHTQVLSIPIATHETNLLPCMQIAYAVMVWTISQPMHMQSWCVQIHSMNVCDHSTHKYAILAHRCNYSADSRAVTACTYNYVMHTCNHSTRMPSQHLQVGSWTMRMQL